MGLHLKSFILFSNVSNVIKCLIDRSFKICNNCNSVHNDIENTKSNLIKNAFLIDTTFLIDKVIKEYFDHKLFSNKNYLKDTSDVYYFKLSYIGNLSHHIKIKFQNFTKNFVKKILSKIKIFFSYKDPIHDDLKSF